jgi:hypothetical protein
MHLLKTIQNSYYVFSNFQILKDAECPILAVLSSFPSPKEMSDGALMKHFELLINKQNCQCINVEGSHELYMNNPERVAPYILKFLTNQRCAL